MTFREFITECELYEYSDEYYQLMKECTELDIMGKYIENQLVLKEYSDIIPNSLISNGYFTESASDDKLSVIMEKADKKKESILNKIINTVKRMIDSLLVFLGKKPKFETKRETAIRKLKSIPKSVSKKMKRLKIKPGKILIGLAFAVGTGAELYRKVKPQLDEIRWDNAREAILFDVALKVIENRYVGSKYKYKLYSIV